MKRPIKLLYVVPTLAKSGPINQLYNLICNLDLTNYDPYLLSLSPEPPNSKVADFVRYGIPCESLSLTRTQMMLIGRRELSRAINRIRPDIIHSYCLRPDLFVNKCAHNCVHCNTIHNYPYEDYPAKYGKLLGVVMARMHMGVHRRIRYPVSCSFSIAEKLMTRHNLYTHVIQNGINIEQYAPAGENEKAMLRLKLGLPNRRLFVSVGSMIERKDPLLIIQAFRASAAASAGGLVILGDGPLRNACETLANDSIWVKGNVGNVADYLKACDVFVSSSRSEGLPNAALEAMGAGLPLILSDIEPHREVLARCPEVGALFPTGDISGLTQCLDRAMQWDFKAMGEGSRQAVEMSFSSGRMSRSYQEFYQSIVQPNHSAMELVK